MKRAGLLRFQGRASRVQEDLWPGEVVMGGVVFEVATAGRNAERESLVVGGMEVDVDFSFRILKERFPVRPVIGKTVKFEGVRYRILAVDGAQDVAWHVSCGDVDD